ncbi:GspH/FimT family pseudopilin [Janthinobacterium sp. 17J80-10]|uniref:GspH/FimT family pseudopilin n=1 Tax=Janthinobacterium sp. 17J80-10 TaxID=2497863 RepID=UPI0010054158|nr:GspH/FimT family pseudopilin [Janthinobacterium sp. 17J80-10]QAU34274.1 prepilin-type N-terminal cleavage/methylation domain-containing protein [Janthinobacterium sp. 17J80-10]
MKTSGFTLVELIGVMVIIGILSAVAAPRFFDLRTFDARGFYDQTLAMLRYGQKVAVAQRTNVFVNVTGSGICLTYAADVNCNTAGVTYVVNPADKTKFYKVPPSGVTLASTVSSFSFTGLGSPTQAATVTVSHGGTTRTITIEAATGYVY